MKIKRGNIVEFPNKADIITAVILEDKGDLLKLRTQFDEDITIDTKRIIHTDNDTYIDLSADNFDIAEKLANIALKRDKLAQEIRVKEIWERFKTEKNWITSDRIATLYFGDRTKDHESAVIRALFRDRLYFQFDMNIFLPNTEEIIAKKRIAKKEREREEEIIEYGVGWLNDALANRNNDIKSFTRGERNIDIIEMFKSFYLFGKKSLNYNIVKNILSSYGKIGDSDASERRTKISKIEEKEIIFEALVNLEIWDRDVNLDILRYNIPIFFTEEAKKEVEDTVRLSENLLFKDYNNRKDLTMLRSLTIDGNLTCDFDDAISIEEQEENYILGIHISDVGHFIKKNGELDREAEKRGSSIYMPDGKISMLPDIIAEDICSLKEDKTSHAISVMIKLDKNFNIKKYDIFPSIIRVHKRLTYYNANLLVSIDKDLEILYKIGLAFREKRLADNAIYINLPEVNLWVDQDKKNITVNKIDKERPSRLIVSEIMIACNWIIGQFLSDNDMPAIFRGQHDPYRRFFTGFTDNLFKNWIQRRGLSPFILSDTPIFHAGLGLKVYTTATSPIRKYYDLINQRQIRAVLGLETPYTKEQIKDIMYCLKEPMYNISKIQQARNRYWLLRYLEKRIGEREKGLVVGKTYNNYSVLLTEYMLLCHIPVSYSYTLRQEESVTVVISNVNASKNILRSFLEL